MRFLQRNIDKELISWSKDIYMKPLLLRGARQVGKTSAVRHLAESFEYYVEVDLNTRQDLHPLFNRSIRQNVPTWVLANIKYGRVDVGVS